MAIKYNLTLPQHITTANIIWSKPTVIQTSLSSAALKQSAARHRSRRRVSEIRCPKV